MTYKRRAVWHIGYCIWLVICQSWVQTPSKTPVVYLSKNFSFKLMADRLRIRNQKSLVPTAPHYPVHLSEELSTHCATLPYTYQKSLVPTAPHYPIHLSEEISTHCATLPYTYQKSLVPTAPHYPVHLSLS